MVCQQDTDTHEEVSEGGLLKDLFTEVYRWPKGQKNMRRHSGLYGKKGGAKKRMASIDRLLTGFYNKNLQCCSMRPVIIMKNRKIIENK